MASPIQTTRLAHLHPDLVGLDMEQIQPGLRDDGLMDPLALRPSAITPRGDGAFIETVGLDNGLHRTSKG
jgi:hypothetical protein